MLNIYSVLVRNSAQHSTKLYTNKILIYIVAPTRKQQLNFVLPVPDMKNRAHEIN